MVMEEWRGGGGDEWIHWIGRPRRCVGLGALHSATGATIHKLLNRVLNPMYLQMGWDTHTLLEVPMEDVC